jgi:predicted TIM-barrel fold metal-dependent hydrolase
MATTLPITDAQVHVFELDRTDRPWMGKGGISSPGTALRPDGFGGDDLIAEMDAVGVSRAVLVPPSVVGFNNATCLEAAAKYPERLAVMGLFNPLRPEATSELETWLQQPGMLGVRMSFLPGFSLFDVGAADPSMEPFWADCERLGIPVMVNVPGQLPDIDLVASKHPELTVIIDHMGQRSGQPTVPEVFAHLDELLALAKHPKVYVKMTAAPRCSRQPFPHRDIHPYLQRMHRTFGPQRLMWGSDLTTMTTPYSECLELFQRALPFLTDDDRDWILSRTIATVLNWPTG